MGEMEPSTLELSKLLIDEILVAGGVPRVKFYRALGWLLFHRITDQFTTLAEHFDMLVGKKGLPKASEWLLTHFCNPAQVHGIENVPKMGPLLVASNHPGAYDGLVLFALLGRQDILWVSTEIKFFRFLKNTREHILFSSRVDATDRFIVMRNAIHHLRSGGTLVYFAQGARDPDPAVFDGADRALDNWLDTFSTFFRTVPGLRVLPAVVSGVISSRWAHHPITWIRRQERWKHIVSEFAQVIHQLVHPGRLMVSPAVSFGRSFDEAEILQEIGNIDLRTAVIAREKLLLQKHYDRILRKKNETVIKT
jgi:hypothetical protein